ncbi:MAG TPA: DMT family transporter [Segeticoccus sp.]|uniref:DMT family transporter n=1 Tax=Segeticoccus sp. TaxID=2706531 RepID=UPI002D803B84|nr:DMT family transporter [Segeticoccus sp.]HET8600292.1 DMT family transporter [Segeticoccus sp.]
MRSPRTGQLATCALVAVTAAWGSTFFLIRDVVQQLSPTDFLAVRFGIAAVAMAVLFWRPMRALQRREVLVGCGLGLIYGIAQVLQTVGLAHTSASRSGFITGTYVVLTPLLGALILRDRIPRTTWLAVALATAGLAVLSLRHLGFSYGDLLTLASAAAYALHIIGLGRYSTPRAAAGLAAVQMIVIAVVCTAFASPGGIELPSGGGAWASVVYMGVIAGALAIWAQTWAQSHLTATRAAIVMTLEPVFAAFFAVVSGQESITTRMLFGGALVVGAMYLVELAGRREARAPAPDPELLHHRV